MSHSIPIKFGISQNFPCNYLPQKQERLLVAIDSIIKTAENYEQLMALGFRRSGDQVYRPHCQNCDACQSIRIPVQTFSASKSQKRTLKKAREFTVYLNQNCKDIMRYYPLFEKYINQRHSDGSMYPANVEQYTNFILISWLPVAYMEVLEGDKLISVSVVDVLPNSYSAVYTFFDPDYEHFSLGRFAILQMIELARASQKQFVYLGYQVDGCRKMNYKTQYTPHQRLIGGHWIDS
ncbi:arginyltransferase [Catenovulum sp. 2E275]|uniref:arginyltransferase n=1 Tax=Catenovulum sp. 2E275 TaxID=2980497 RepID=UPI0021D24089|nr:arginyltransferase [Catenovulum sp. 2E275]MCU4674678.1 arginyltransferase [Catenovulum sp. 2E275]